jgi:CrcB protein
VTTPAEIAAVFLGGGAGALARFAVARGTMPYLDAAHFHWATFAVNVAGSALLGLAAAGCHARPTLLLFVGTGFCGGFTTFSSYAVETVKLLEAHRPLTATAYAASTVLAALAAAYLGLHLFKGRG